MHVMPEPGFSKEGYYLYAISGEAQARTYDVPGIDGQAVYSVADGQVAAVVSVFSSACSPSSVKSRTMKPALASETLPLMVVGCR